MNRLVRTLVFVCLLPFSASCRAHDCQPAPPDVAVLREIRPMLHMVEGPLAAFDPCHASVSFQKPLFSNQPPLMIVVHGGGGLDSGARNAAQAFRSKGFATLLFDAYELNGFSRGIRFWSTQATNESRQRMIYKATLGAYEWALKQMDIDNRQIYFYGLSNGATVIVNLAGVVSPQHVKGIFAEGAPGMGLGLPDQINVPLRLIYGKLDNYGGRTQDDWIWLRQELCSFNVSAFIQPRGNAQTCSFDINRNDLTPKPIDWYENQKKRGADIDLWFYENAAHGVFLGTLQRNTITYGRDLQRYAWSGGDATARQKMLEDIERHRQGKQ